MQEGNIFTQAKATVTVHKKSINPNPVDPTTKEPTLAVKRTATIIKGSSFDPRSLIIKAVDRTGKDMTSEVIIDADSLDTQKVAAYTVKYRLRVDGKLLRAESYIAVVEKSTTDPNNGAGSTKKFTTQYSLTDSKIFKRNNCPIGTISSTVNYVTTATKTASAYTQEAADTLAKQLAE